MSTPSFKQQGRGAFPSQTSDSYWHGMTLREWYAGQALAGLAMEHPRCSAIELAADAFAFADAMIEAGKEQA